MFEKLEEEIEVKADEYALEESTACNYGESSKHVYQGYFYGFKKGAEFGYNKAKEDVKHDLMMKLKNEGIVKPLKDSILRNERLSSQEQQELCAWIECAMDFGENLDECAKELEEANKANEWHYVKDGDLPKHEVDVLVLFNEQCIDIAHYNYDYKRNIR